MKENHNELHLFAGAGGGILGGMKGLDYISNPGNCSSTTAKPKARLGCLQGIVRHLQRWWHELRPQYRTVEGRAATYEAADRLIRETANLEDPNRWEIWTDQEDSNRVIGVCYIRRRERIG